MGPDRKHRAASLAALLRARRAFEERLAEGHPPAPRKEPPFLHDVLGDQNASSARMRRALVITDARERRTAILSGFGIPALLGLLDSNEAMPTLRLMAALALRAVAQSGNRFVSSENSNVRKSAEHDAVNRDITAVCSSIVEHGGLKTLLGVIIDMPSREAGVEIIDVNAYRWSLSELGTPDSERSRSKSSAKRSWSDCEDAAPSSFARLYRSAFASSQFGRSKLKTHAAAVLSAVLRGHPKACHDLLFNHVGSLRSLLGLAQLGSEEAKLHVSSTLRQLAHWDASRIRRSDPVGNVLPISTLEQSPIMKQDVAETLVALIRGARMFATRGEASGALLHLISCGGSKIIALVRCRGVDALLALAQNASESLSSDVQHVYRSSHAATHEGTIRDALSDSLDALAVLLNVEKRESALTVAKSAASHAHVDRSHFSQGASNRALELGCLSFLLRVALQRDTRPAALRTLRALLLTADHERTLVREMGAAKSFSTVDMTTLERSLLLAISEVGLDEKELGHLVEVTLLGGVEVLTCAAEEESCIKWADTEDSKKDALALLWLLRVSIVHLQRTPMALISLTAAVRALKENVAFSVSPVARFITNDLQASQPQQDRASRRSVVQLVKTGIGALLPTASDSLAIACAHFVDLGLEDSSISNNGPQDDNGVRSSRRECSGSGRLESSGLRFLKGVRAVCRLLDLLGSGDRNLVRHAALALNALLHRSGILRRIEIPPLLPDPSFQEERCDVKAAAQSRKEPNPGAWHQQRILVQHWMARRERVWSTLKRTNRIVEVTIDELMAGWTAPRSPDDDFISHKKNTSPDEDGLPQSTQNNAINSDKNKTQAEKEQALRINRPSCDLLCIVGAGMDVGWHIPVHRQVFTERSPFFRTLITARTGNAAVSHLNANAPKGCPTPVALSCDRAAKVSDLHPPKNMVQRANDPPTKRRRTDGIVSSSLQVPSFSNRAGEARSLCDDALLDGSPKLCCPEDLAVVRLPGVEPATFLRFLDYLYVGHWKAGRFERYKGRILDAIEIELKDFI